ncbi:hypothetical protein MMC07_004467 [Pseudocyphellaria aurata]|nr:hypothetical protein [Pseudocyphellaria aurata]
MTTHETTRFLNTLRDTLNLLSHLHVPTIAAVGGHAHGGGLELALTTDLRVFSTAALVSVPETRLGIIPGAGGTHRLPMTIGRSRALEMVLTGEKLSGTKAYSWGLCERLVEAPPGKSWDKLQDRIEPNEPDQKKQERRELYLESRDAVLEESLRLAHTICEGAPLAIGAALRAVKAGTESAEKLEYDAVLGTQDRNRALVAFAKKQTPRFEGN